MKKAVSLGLCVLLLLPLWGCGGRELYERLLIHGVGVDREGEEFLVTVRSSSAPGEEGEECFQCRGKTVLEALNSLSLSTGRQPFYAHNYLVIFGGDCAARGLDEAVDFFVRYYNTRPAVQLFLTRGRAEELLTFQKEGKYLSLSHLQQLRDAERDTGRAVTVDLLEFVNASRRQGSSPLLPVIGLKEDQAQLDGAAYFRGDRPAGYLTPAETRGFLAVKDRLKGGSVALTDPAFGGVTLTLADGAGKVTLERGGDLPEFTVKVELDADVSAMDGGRARLEPEQYPLAEAALARLVKGEIRGALNKAVRESGCDIFGFGTLLYQRDPHRWESLAEDWPELMARCEYRIEVTARVSRLGSAE